MTTPTEGACAHSPPFSPPPTPASTRIGPLFSPQMMTVWQRDAVEEVLLLVRSPSTSWCPTQRLRRRSPSSSAVSVPELHSGTEGLLLSNGEDQEKTLPAAEVIVPDGSIVLLASGVQNVDLDLLPVQNHFLPVAVGLGGLVILHKLWKTKQDTVGYLQTADVIDAILSDGTETGGK